VFIFNNRCGLFLFLLFVLLLCECSPALIMFHPGENKTCPGRSTLFAGPFVALWVGRGRVTSPSFFFFDGSLCNPIKIFQLETHYQKQSGAMLNDGKNLRKGELLGPREIKRRFVLRGPNEFCDWTGN